MSWCGDSNSSVYCVTLHIQADMTAAAGLLRCFAMTPPQKTGSRPGTSRHRETAMVCLLLIGMMYQHSVNIDHNKCPSSEKSDEKCILGKSNFHQILPINGAHCYHTYCSSWKLRLCRRIASECMMVISSGQCVSVVSLFIGSVLLLPIIDTSYWPLTRDSSRVNISRIR